MRKIERIFVHCTASKQSRGVKELWAEFRHKGWKQPGYHYVITADGAIHQMLAVEEVSNGVKGYTKNWEKSCPCFNAVEEYSDL